MLTNNVREWQPIWRGALRRSTSCSSSSSTPASRARASPSREIYARTLARLDLPGDQCAFVDDVEVNVTAAREAGMHGIHFRDTAQVVAELDPLVLAA